jgi:outer membrane protein OmpA-like peptidoglycan-associated protein
VFEVGPVIEPTELAVSIDAEQWVDVGSIKGARAELDLAGAIDPQESYRFVRLINRSGDCRGRYPGADIDAVAAVGSALRLSLDSSVLFDVDSSQLRPEARAEIERVAGLIVKHRTRGEILVEGHTDSDGDAAHNQALSEARAESVSRELQNSANIDATRLRSVGYGETRPLVRNDSAQDKARNRRVEIILR